MLEKEWFLSKHYRRNWKATEIPYITVVEKPNCSCPLETPDMS